MYTTAVPLEQPFFFTGWDYTADFLVENFHIRSQIHKARFVTRGARDLDHTVLLLGGLSLKLVSRPPPSVFKLKQHCFPKRN